MSYGTGSITSAQPGKDLMDTLKTQIDNHAAWVFIEEVAGTGTNVAQVFKCDGTVNSFGTDFYMALVRTSLTDSVGVGISEAYDSVNKKLQSPAVCVTGATSFTPTASSQFPTDRHVANESAKSLTNGWFSSGAQGQGISGLGVRTSAAFTYWFSITNDRCMFATQTTGSNFGTYAGLYSSFHSSGTDGFPLFVTNLATASTGLFQTTNANGAFTRMPGQGANALTFGWQGYMSSTPWTITKADNNSGVVSKEAIEAKWLAARILCQESARRCAVHGLLKDCYFLNMLENTEAQGDTLTIDGTLYTAFNTTIAEAIWVSQSA